MLVTERTGTDYVNYVQINAPDDAFIESDRPAQLETQFGELHYIPGIVRDSSSESDGTATYNGITYSIVGGVITPLPDVYPE